VVISSSIGGGGIGSGNDSGSSNLISVLRVLEATF
jgi:hypothetical protein